MRTYTRSFFVLLGLLSGLTLTPVGATASEEEEPAYEQLQAEGRTGGEGVKDDLQWRTYLRLARLVGRKLRCTVVAEREDDREVRIIKFGVIRR